VAAETTIAMHFFGRHSSLRSNSIVYDSGRMSTVGIAIITLNQDSSSVSSAVSSSETEQAAHIIIHVAATTIRKEAGPAQHGLSIIRTNSLK